MSDQYPAQWDYVEAAYAQNRLAQALLFVGPYDCALADFTKQLTQLVCCKTKKRCLVCMDCHLIQEGKHPDVQWIKPEKIGGAIKIDQIRGLHNQFYLTPQRAPYRLIVIESADRMNNAAANSLLKILEEPTEHTLFVLIAQQLSTVLPTILSRCQMVRFASHYDVSSLNLLNLSEHYAQESLQALIVKQAEPILEGLIAVREKMEHPCVVVAQWGQFELSTLLWFLYLVYAQIQIIQIKTSLVSGPALKQLQHLATLINPILLYKQIDKINSLQRKLNHNMHLNQTLVLEDLLFDLSDF